MKRFTILLVAVLVVVTARAQSNDAFTVATYNLENWLLMVRHNVTNAPKPAAERDAVVNVLAGIRPDVLGVEEMGTTNELADLTSRLQARGLDFPHHEWIQGGDPNRHVALLSRFPIVERCSETNATYRLNGAPHTVERGILDVVVRVSDEFSFHAIVVHLKSKREVTHANQAQMRWEEARLLRRHVNNLLERDPQTKIVVMGDFNDTPETEPIHAVIGDGATRLFALHPRDSKGYDTTHLWRWHRQYSRIDYLMLSPAMTKHFIKHSERIADPKGWLDASDHRAVSAKFSLTGNANSDGTLPEHCPTCPLEKNPQILLILVAFGVVLFLAWLIARRRSRK